MKRFFFAALLSVAALPFVLPAPAAANETDQFSVTADLRLADVGDYFSRDVYNDLVAVCTATNARIREALARADNDPQRANLDKYHSPRHIAQQVASRHGLGFVEAERLESTFKSDDFEAHYPGAMVLYRPERSIYRGALWPIDPRNLALISLNSTVNVYGNHFGLDKIGHFHQCGYSYFKRAVGSDDERDDQAGAGAVSSFSSGIVSEGGLTGSVAAGVYSNADLAANYMGMKFYLNLTRATRLQGTMHPPMLVLDGSFWRLNDHVTATAPLFAPFVSEHFNEALNPSLYGSGMRKAIAKKVRAMASHVLAFYRGDQGVKRDRAYFEAKLQELTTYYGEDYGHKGKPSQLVTIADTCFPKASKSKSAVLRQ